MKLRPDHALPLRFGELSGRIQPRSLGLTEPILCGVRWWAYAGMALIWLATALWFWVWWFDPAHLIGAGRFWLVTGLVAWVYALQAYFVVLLLRARRPVGAATGAPLPAAVAGLRVAMVVTKTPSEPLSVLIPTLQAMLAQDHPHDTWLADEDPDAATQAWCAAHGVRISTRKGRADYHRAVWPRRTRCKEGNLAFFYDHWGYADYDVVSQLDADHIPQPGYLREMLRPFADAGVGYVSAPSVCGRNAQTSWAARTRLYTEAAFHGVLQSGYNAGLAPMCIGSHYAVRTAALKRVGGLGPDLAEDHSTTLLLNAGGWRGVHAMDAIALGDGPTTVADMVTQEFQWSRSLVTLLLQHTPRYLGRLPWRLRAQFLFCQMLYPIFAVTMAAMYLLPIVALLGDIRYVDVTYPAFLGHALPTVASLLLISYALKWHGVFRPHDAPVIAWEKVLFVLLQWPWVLWGCVMALRDRVAGDFVDFRITPKGAAAGQTLPLRVVLVYVVLALGCIVPVLAMDGVTEARGFYLLSLFGGVLYSTTVAVIVGRHLAETGLRWWRGTAALSSGALVGLMVLIGTSFALRGAEGLHALTIGAAPFQVTKTQFIVSGAGGGAPGQVRIGYQFNWGESAREWRALK